MRGQTLAIIAAVALTGPPAQAQDQSAADLVEQRIREMAPRAQSIAVSETPIEGILQVQVNGDIVYASSDGKYLFQGRVIDMETREDLTENAKATLRRELLVDLNEEEQITFGPDDAVHELMVFTDIDCGYCRKLHSQVEEYGEQGITIHYMSFPRAGIGSQSYEKAVSVWCAANPQEAMTQAKLGEEITQQQCENPVAQQYQLGLDLGVTGTPALLTSDGNLIPGYVPPDSLRARLDSMAASAAD